MNTTPTAIFHSQRDLEAALEPELNQPLVRHLAIGACVLFGLQHVAIELLHGCRHASGYPILPAALGLLLISSTPMLAAALAVVTAAMAVRWRKARATGARGAAFGLAFALCLSIFVARNTLPFLLIWTGSSRDIVALVGCGPACDRREQ